MKKRSIDIQLTHIHRMPAVSYCILVFSLVLLIYSLVLPTVYGLVASNNTAPLDIVNTTESVTASSPDEPRFGAIIELPNNTGIPESGIMSPDATLDSQVRSIDPVKFGG